jgi:hypothetical protein
MKVRTIPAGTTEKFQLNYVPEKLIIENLDKVNTSIRNFVAVKVTPLGVGVICDLDKAGVLVVDAFNKKGGYYLNNTFAIEIPLADGLVPDKVTDYEITNDSTADIAIYAPVTKRATLYVKSMQQTLLAKSQAVFSKFIALGFIQQDESQCTVDFEDSTNHTYSLAELAINNTKKSIENIPIVYNEHGTVKKATVIPTVEIQAYLVRYINL